MLGLMLLTSHMIGDYVLQSDAQAQAKLHNLRALLLHCFTYTLAFAPLLLFGLHWLALPIVFLSHVLIDHRRWVEDPPWPPKTILVDQTLHLVVLCLIGVI